MALIDAYTGPMRWGPNASNFYIHIHQENIGRAEDGPTNDIIKTFADQKQDAGAAAMNYYKQLLMESVTPDSRELLEQIFDQDNDENDLLAEMDKQFKEQIAALLNSDLIERILHTQKELSARNIGRDIELRGEPAINAFNDLIDTLVATSSFIKGPAGEALAALLIKQKHAEGERFLAVTKGRHLQTALEAFIKDNKKEGATYDQQAAVHLAKKINSLAKHLKYDKKEKGKKPTETSINNIINKIIFSQGFIEAAAGTLKDTVNATLSNMEAEIVAENTGKIQLTDKFGNIIGWDQTSTSSAGKADIKFKNFTLTLKNIGSINQGALTLDVGASVKGYVTNSFGGQDSKTSDLFGSGSGGTILEALTAIFGDSNIRAFYLAYNVLAHGSSRSEETQALNDILLTRQIVRLFSSRTGNKDFSHLMIMNGEVMTIFEILMLTKHFVGKSKSVQNEQQVMLSIPDRKKIEAMGKQEGLDRYARVKNLNAAINKAKINAYIRMKKMG